MLRIFLTLLVVLICHAASHAAEIEVAPERVNPGDAFMVRLTAAEREPVGVHEGGWLNFASCGDGCFVAIGVVDLDVAAGSYEVRLSEGGETMDVSLDVLHKKFPVTDITLQPEKVTLSPEDEKRAEREAQMLDALWAEATERLWQGKFMLPADKGLSTAFGVKRIMNRVKTSVHKGLDMKGREGEPVMASNRGRVALAEDLFYGGNTLVLDHGQGIYTVYMHLSKFGAATGDVVEKGDIIGAVGATGRATGPHLHFSVKVGVTSTNPAAFTKLPL
jgi:murein DD-endopeptidase MepM/ murein hydrolase activator NlpD